MPGMPGRQAGRQAGRQYQPIAAIKTFSSDDDRL